MNVGKAIAVGVQLAVKVTVPFAVLKSLNQVAVTFVSLLLHEFVTLVLAVPYLVVLVLKLVSAVHPANVCEPLVAAPILAPVLLTEPDHVTVLLGLFI